MSKHVVKVAAAVAFALAAAGSGSLAFAQSSEGSLYGKVAPGTSVTLTSSESGTTRTITADSSGNFNASRLPPGKYTVSAGGKEAEVIVSIGGSSQVDLDKALTTVKVTSGRVGGIDFKSTETNFVFSQEQVQALPVALSVNAVAALSPTVLKGDPNLGSGNLPSFAGSSVAENAYYINGFDVTNIRNFLSYADLPFEAIAQQQVKAGGYGAEYGRSLGGVISIVTKRGTNEWKGGVSMIWEPAGLRSRGHDLLDKEPDREGSYWLFSSKNTEDQFTTTAYLGGPIINDKLFIFGLVERTSDRADLFGQNQSTVLKSDTPSGMVKLDWNINDKNLLEVTGIYNKQRSDFTDFDSDKNYSTSHDGQGRNSWIYTGGTVLIGKYTGYVTDNLTVSADLGQVKSLAGVMRGARTEGQDCPVVYNIGATTPLGCWIPPFPSAGGRDPLAPSEDDDNRTAGRLDVEYHLGQHALKAGLDIQDFKSTQAGGSTFSGGHYYRYYAPTSVINGVAQATPTAYVRDRISAQTSGKYQVVNTAYYIEDNWRATSRLNLYAGLRAESFDNKNSQGISFAKKENLIAPRLGFSLDITNEQPTKLYGTAGRYYIPIASNTNIRATRAEFQTTSYYTYNGTDPRTAAPLNLGPSIGTPQVVGSTSLPNPSTIVDTALKPMNQDEFILGIERTLESNWTLGGKLIYRKINAGMDDYCDRTAFTRFAADKGFTKFSATSLAPCVLVNPGNDVHIAMNINNDGNYVVQTVPASYTGLAKYTRTYQAAEFTFEKPFNGVYGLRGSYVLSFSKGTAEGYVNSIINQEDAGVSQDFDFGSLTDGSNGYLPNDRRHVFKLFGNYGITQKLVVGANLTMASGRPLSCIGFVPPTVKDFAAAGAYSTASSFYCLNSKGVAELHDRGTFGRTPSTAQVDLQLAYTSDELVSNGTLKFAIDVFNAFNSSRPIELYETRDYSRATSNAASGNQLNANYGQPTSFQTPRYFRLSARYSF